MFFENRLAISDGLGSHFPKLIAVFALQFIGGKLGDALLALNSGGISPVWPASGIALGAVLVWGYSVWPGIAAGSLLLTLLGGLPLWAAVTYAAGTTLAALIAALLLRRVAKFDNSLSHLNDVLALISLGAFTSSVVSASIGAPTLYAAHVTGWSGLRKAWLIYFLGDTAGVLLVTPVALTLPIFLRVTAKKRIAELSALLTLLIATCFTVFYVLPIWLDILTFSVLPFVMWAAIRFGVGATSLAILLIATIATVETALGHGPFVAYTQLTKAALLDTFIGVVSIAGLTLAAMGAEREQSVREQAAMETRLLDSEAIKESEDKLRLILDSTAEAIFGVDTANRCTFCNIASLRVLGYGHSDDLLGKQIHSLIHHTRADNTPLPLKDCSIYRVVQTGQGVHADGEIMWRADGTSFPVEYWSYPQRRGNKIVGAVVAFLDITERKRADAALATVSRRLIEAQEQERSRIGRELHDDITQRLALLAVELDKWSHDKGLPGHEQFMHAQQRISDISRDVQALSHRLHSSKLDYLGLTHAARSFCKELSESAKVEVQFSHSAVPAMISKEISLCLFRVLQEALQNAVKHSGVQTFCVNLCGITDGIELTVSDNGKGFEERNGFAQEGLGLISMRERVQMVHGVFGIKTQPGTGTTISVQIPIRKDESQPTVG